MLLLAALTVLIIAAIPAANAKECRYSKNEIDDFTNEKLLTTKWHLFHTAIQTTGFAYASGITVGDRDYLAIRIATEETLSYELDDDELRTRFVVPEGASLLILLADDTIVELPAQQQATGVARSSSADSRDSGNSLEVRYEVKLDAVIRYSLNASAFEALSSQTATHVRLTTNSGDHDFEVHDKLTDEIQKAVLCLKQDTV